MSFLNPLALLALLGIPVLVLLYFLKLKRPRVTVASTLLWQKVIEDMRVNAPFQKLKRSLLLLLQVLILAAAAFALARPILSVRDTRDESLIVLLDTSASMLAREPGGKTRLQLAREEILREAVSLGSGREMMLIVFHRAARVACGFTTNRRRLRETVLAVRGAETGTDVAPALRLAESVATTRRNPRVLLFSDGAFDSPGRVGLPAAVEYRRIGSPRPNLAVTSLDIRRATRERTRVEMFVALENLATREFSGNMSVSLDGKDLDSKFFSVPAGETLSQVFRADLAAGGTFEVAFDADDALACDNRAWKVIPPPARRELLLVGEDNFFLERICAASPGTSYRSVTPAEIERVSPEAYSTVIWNAVAAPKVLPTDSIYLGCVPPAPGFTAGPAIKNPDIVDWATGHPVNRFLDFNNLLVSAAVTLGAPEEATILLRSSSTPLAVLALLPSGVVCVTAFDPRSSNWPLLVSFPVFLQNCLGHFEELRTARLRTNIAAGAPIAAASPGGRPTVTLPSGETVAMSRGASGEYLFADTSRCGIYRVDLPGGEVRHVAANLFNRAESRLETADTLTLGNDTIAAAAGPARITREYWKPLLAGCVAILLLEWLVYHRRLLA